MPANTNTNTITNTNAGTNENTRIHSQAAGEQLIQSMHSSYKIEEHTGRGRSLYLYLYDIYHTTLNYLLVITVWHERRLDEVLACLNICFVKDIMHCRPLPKNI